MDKKKKPFDVTASSVSCEAKQLYKPFIDRLLDSCAVWQEDKKS